jgi:hypothetical protein
MLTGESFLKGVIGAVTYWLERLVEPRPYTQQEWNRERD